MDSAASLLPALRESIKLVGIINVTPDSFSDGGSSYTQSQALTHAEKLLAEGAHILELGGDSTRPGSTCVGIDEEWRRIGDLIPQISRLAPLCIDTHHAQIAERAIDLGAAYINDISAGADPQMFSTLAGSNAKIILMHSRCQTPHSFGPSIAGDVIKVATNFLKARVEGAIRQGIAPHQIILDPGIGAFLSDDPKVSLELLERFGELLALNYPLFLGTSRKGFLRSQDESSPSDRDQRSAESALTAARQIPEDLPLYIRAHHIALHRELLACEL